MEMRTFGLVVFCVVWTSVAALTVTIPQSSYEFARGDNITLPCSYKFSIASPSSAVITWAVGTNIILTYYYPAGDIDVSDGYQSRTSLDVDFNAGKANLKLNSVTQDDNANYICRLQVPKDYQGQPYASTQLTVLVAPSPPDCKIQGKAEYGQNINLTCVSAEGSPPPTYKWDSRDVQNNPRVPDPKTTDKGGILSLYNISKDTSGYYICTSANKIRSATCNLTVSVMPPSMNVGSTAAIIGGVVAALVLLVIIIYCCCCRKKEEKEEYAMGVHQEEYHDAEPVKKSEGRNDVGQESGERRDNYEEKSERSNDRQKDYDDRRSDYDDRRSDYDDRRSDYRDRRDYDDRRSDYDDRRSDYNDRRSDYNDRRDYDDRRSDYDDRRSDYDDRRNKYDRRERYDDDRRNDDERRYNDRKGPRSDGNRDKP